MAPRYSLLDEQDQLGSLLDPNTLESLRPTAYETSPSPQPSAAPVMPDLHPRDPQVDEAWRGLELQKIQEAQKPSYGLGEAARDVIPTGLALALDAALNHGRGAVGVLQGGMNEVGNQQALRDKARASAGDLAVKIHGKDGSDDPLAYLRAQTAMQNAGTNATRVGNSQQHWAAAGDPNDPHTQGVVTIGGQKAGAAARGRILEEDKLNPIVAGDKAAIRTAETTAELGAKHEGAPVANADEADKARLVAEAKLPTETTIKQTPTAADTRAAGIQADANSAPPGFRVANEQAWRAFSADPTRRAAADQYLTKGETTRKALERMIALRTEIGPSWSTLTDAEKATKLDEMALTQQGAVGGFTGIGALGVLNAGEFPRVGATMPNGSASLSDLYDPLLSAFSHGSKRDTQLEQLQGSLSAFNQLYGAGLTQAGLAPGDAAPAQAQGGAAPPPPGDAMPMVPRNGGAPPSAFTNARELPLPNLGDTGGNRLRDVPASPTAGVTRIRKPDGTVIESRLPLDQLANLPNGWELVR